MSLNSEICKARSLFLNRGILNRDLLKDEIVYSWVRSKLHNISFELLNQNEATKKIDISSLDIFDSKIIKYLRNIQTENSMIYLSDFTGDILYGSEKSNLEFPNFTNFSEDSIGTNAVGITINTQENMTVFGCEHYNKILINFISSSILIEDILANKKKIIGVITPIVYDVAHTRLLNLIERHFQSNEENSDSNQNLEIIEGEIIDAALNEIIVDKDLVPQINRNDEMEILDGSVNIDQELNCIEYDENQNLVQDVDSGVESYKGNNSIKDLYEKIRHLEEQNKITNNKNSDFSSVNSINSDNNRYIELIEESSNFNECKVFTLSIIEEKTIREALSYYKWNLKKSAEALGIGRSTLYRKLKEYKIEK